MSIADELITRGWTQGTVEDRDGRVCLWGAAVCSAGFATVAEYRAAYGVDRGAGFCVMRSQAEAALWAVSEALNDPIGAWNDAPDRTFDEVLRVAKEADEILGVR